MSPPPCFRLEVAAYCDKNVDDDDIAPLANDPHWRLTIEKPLLDWLIDLSANSWRLQSLVAGCSVAAPPRQAVATSGICEVSLLLILSYTSLGYQTITS